MNRGTEDALDLVSADKNQQGHGGGESSCSGAWEGLWGPQSGVPVAGGGCPNIAGRRPRAGLWKLGLGGLPVLPDRNGHGAETVT